MTGVQIPDGALKSIRTFCYRFNEDVPRVVVWSVELATASKVDAELPERPFIYTVFSYNRGKGFVGWVLNETCMDGKVCLVTGSSRGIGRGVVEELGRRGADVVVNYNTSEEEAMEVVDEIEEMDGSAIAVQADVSDWDDVSRMGERVRREYGSVDVVVNNAGVTVDTKIVDMSKEDWDRVVDVNLTGAFYVTKEFFEDVAEAEEGRVINVSSVVGQRGNYGQANYASSKSGLFGFTRSLALELAPSNSTANCIAPGFTRTDMLEKVRDDIQEKIKEGIPLDRFAEVEDIVGVVAFVAGDHSSYMTGQVLGVNGGMHW